MKQLKYHFVALIALASLFALTPVNAEAEIYKCKGAWQSTPCHEGAKPANLPKLSKAGAVSSYESTSVSEDSDLYDKTRLRLYGDPKWFLKNTIRGLSLEKAEVMVRNYGSKVAKGVVVTLKGRGKEKVQFSGPTSISPGGKEKYTLSSAGYVKPSRKLKAEVACSNCR